MKKQLSNILSTAGAIAILILVILVIAFNDAKAQQNHVSDFYADAKRYGVELQHKQVIIEVRDLNQPTANGRINTMADGSIRIVIDTQFHNYYLFDSQLKRLVYYLLAHELLGLNRGKGIMDSDKVYKPLNEKLIGELFKVRI